MDELRRNSFQNLSKRFPLVRFNCSGVKLDGSSKIFSEVNSPALTIALRGGEKILAGREEQANYQAGRDCTRSDKIAHPGPVVINQPFLRDNVFGVEFKPRIPLTPTHLASCHFHWTVRIIDDKICDTLLLPLFLPSANKALNLRRRLLKTDR